MTKALGSIDLYQRARWFCKQKDTVASCDSLEIKHELFYFLNGLLVEIEMLSELDVKQASVDELTVYLRMMLEDMGLYFPMSRQKYNDQCARLSSAQVAWVVTTVREKFLSFLSRWEAVEWAAGELPYRRYLSRAEVLDCIKTIRERWGIGRRVTGRAIAKDYRQADRAQSRLGLDKTLYKNCVRHNMAWFNRYPNRGMGRLVETLMQAGIERIVLCKPEALFGEEYLMPGNEYAYRSVCVEIAVQQLDECFHEGLFCFPSVCSPNAVNWMFHFYYESDYAVLGVGDFIIEALSMLYSQTDYEAFFYTHLS